MKRNIPYGLALRIQRLVSDEKLKLFRLLQLAQILSGLHYPDKLISDALLQSYNWQAKKKDGECLKWSPKNNTIYVKCESNHLHTSIINSRVMPHVQKIIADYFNQSLKLKMVYTQRNKLSMVLRNRSNNQ